jgi:hypothetical protein
MISSGYEATPVRTHDAGNHQITFLYLCNLVFVDCWNLLVVGGALLFKFGQIAAQSCDQGLPCIIIL